MSEQTIPERIDAANQRAALRSRLKEAYQKMHNNPFRTQHSIFDPVVFRYESARAFTREYYKYTPRSLVAPAILAGLVALATIVVNRENAAKEAKIRSGERSYYERAKLGSKFLY